MADQAPELVKAGATIHQIGNHNSEVKGTKRARCPTTTFGSHWDAGDEPQPAQYGRTKKRFVSRPWGEVGGVKECCG